jgi:hypothetical protein
MAGKEAESHTEVAAVSAGEGFANGFTALAYSGTRYAVVSTLPQTS